MDLNAPLGLGPPPPSRRRLALATLGSVAAVVLGGVGYLLVTADPRGGEPFAVAVLPPSVHQAAPLDPTPTGSLASPSVQNNAPLPPDAPGRSDAIDDGIVENGVRVHRGTSPGSPQAAVPPAPGPLVIDVSRQLDGGPKTRGGTPSNGGSTFTSGTANASSVGSPAASRVAIYVGGMGPNTAATQTAIDTMPAAVSLAFLPYPGKASASPAAARAKGHEVLLQLPMRNGPALTPGAHALDAGATPEALAGDLAWLMSRFDGYVGVTNLLGAPVTADSAAMGAVLRATAARNLFYLDDGTSKRSLAGTLAAQMNVAEAQVDVVLDATSDPAIVRANLDSLVAIARRKGTAIGMASGLPEHLGTIARFAADLSSKKIELVPVSSLARRDTNVATRLR